MKILSHFTITFYIVVEMQIMIFLEELFLLSGTVFGGEEQSTKVFTRINKLSTKILIIDLHIVPSKY